VALASWDRDLLASEEVTPNVSPGPALLVEVGEEEPGAVIEEEGEEAPEGLLLRRRSAGLRGWRGVGGFLAAFPGVVLDGSGFAAAAGGLEGLVLGSDFLLAAEDDDDAEDGVVLPGFEDGVRAGERLLGVGTATDEEG
jgi:hypothetical protein